MNLKTTAQILGIGIVFCLIAADASARRPKPGPDGTCLVPTSCSNNVSAHCAQLYCQALTLKCLGNYSSGACRDIKELHKILMCDLVTDECGGTLPIIVTISGFQIEVTGDERFVVVAADIVDDDNPKRFKAVINGAAKAIRAVESDDNGDDDPDDICDPAGGSKPDK